MSEARESGLLLKRLLPCMCLGVLLTGCEQLPAGRDADVIVVGAGIAGLSAALEASANGARVIVVEANSVGGGHAVKAGGFALVDTALQRSKGIEDSPALAFADWAVRGVDPDDYWADRYARDSAGDVYDWLTDLGVEFRMILPTAEDSVPRFHFTRGTSINAVVPMMRKALRDPNIEFVWNTRVTALARTRGKITGVATTHERTARKERLSAGSVVLTTGGFQSNLELVRANWPVERQPPQRLLAGAGQYATGDGYRLAEWAGASMQRMDRHVIFNNGVPNPRDPARQRGLFAQNPASIWVDASGRRFINEQADDKTVGMALQKLSADGYWLIFDAQGAKRFNMRDAPWLNSDTIAKEILADPALTQQADTVTELARKTGISTHGLSTSVETWNRMIAVGEDFKFGRFDASRKDRNARKISKRPYYAVRVYPMTRKNMGGPAINIRAQVTDASGTAIPGLYAAGELTGVAGINGSYGGAGTFLGPAVLTGRIAGRWAARNTEKAELYTTRKPASPVAGNLNVDATLPGYWHYGVAHSLVYERGYECGSCHLSAASMRPATDNLIMSERLETCTTCH